MTGRNVNSFDWESIGKIPPQAIELEEAILGAVLLEKNALKEVLFLHCDMFYKDSHREIFKAAQELFLRGDPVDTLTVTANLKKSGKLDFAGGAYGVTQLTSKVNSAQNIVAHARIVLEKYLLRESIKMASKIHSIAYDDVTDFDDVLSYIETCSIELAKHTMTGQQIITMPEMIEEVIEDIKNAENRGGGITGLSCGIQNVDNITAGWQKSDLIIIAARPGMGKTDFAITMAKNISIDNPVPVGLIEIEMSHRQLGARLLAQTARISRSKIKAGTIRDDGWNTVNNNFEKMNSGLLYVYDSPTLNLSQLKSQAHLLKVDHKIELLIVDYLQLINGGKENTRDIEIGNITRALKAIARELEIPVIVLCQLSRAVETRAGDRKPRLSDLRESGNIEQDADVVGFLWRPKYYGMDPQNMGGGYAELIFSKHRNGPLDVAELHYDDDFGIFENYYGKSLDEKIYGDAEKEKTRDDLPF